MTATLKITDGTTEISLLNGDDGFFLNAWRPTLPPLKGGGVWQSSPLSDGRRLVTRQSDNAVETFDLKAGDGSQDSLIYVTQELRRLLEKAVDYWITDWQTEPVWIEAQATCESNSRYALIHSYATPDDDNPYNAPFLAHRGAAMDNWTLVLERGHWLADEPGTGTCVQISGLQTDAYAEDRIYYPEASADDAYEIEGVTFNVGGTFVSFGNLVVTNNILNAGIRFRNVNVQPGATIDNAFIRFTATSTISDATVRTNIFGEDNSYPQSFINATDYNARTRTSASVAWDFATTWTLGNTYDTVDISSVIQEIINRDDWVAGNDLVIFIEDDGSDNDAYRNGASLDNVTYDEPALHIDHFGRIVGRTETCDNEVYIGNKHNKAQLTHVFVDDGGVFGSNLLDAVPPYDLLPAVPAVSDAVYFGSDTSTGNSGPFSNLVFDLSVAQSDLTDVVWEYYNGAWTSISNIQDNTDAGGAMTGEPFDTTGVASVHWFQPTDWTTVDPGMGVTGYWVRARVNTIGAAPTAPTHQNRDVYTITWPYVELDSDQVGGDIAALLSIMAFGQSSNSSTALLPFYLLAGLRSASRGEDFTAYLNAADTQNVSGLTVAAGTTTAFATSSAAPSGRVARYNPAGADSIASRVTFTFSDDLANQYRGVFRVYGRFTSDGSTTTFSIQLETQLANGVAIFTTDTHDIPVSTTISNTFIDFGKITLPPTSLIKATAGSFIISVNVGSDNGTDNLDIIDLILIPVDEWTGYFSTPDESLLSTAIVTTNYLDVESIDPAGLELTSTLRSESDGAAEALYSVVSNNSVPILQANARQRLWFFQTYKQLAGGGANIPISYHELCLSIQLTTAQRYLSMRGNR